MCVCVCVCHTSITGLQEFFNYSGHYDEIGTVPPPPNVRKGDIGIQRGREWKNWVGNASSHPELIFFPSELEHLVEIVQYARQQRHKRRV